MGFFSAFFTSSCQILLFQAHYNCSPRNHFLKFSRWWADLWKSQGQTGIWTCVCVSVQRAVNLRMMVAALKASKNRCNYEKKEENRQKYKEPKSAERCNRQTLLDRLTLKLTGCWRFKPCKLVSHLMAYRTVVNVRWLKDTQTWWSHRWREAVNDVDCVVTGQFSIMTWQASCPPTPWTVFLRSWTARPPCCSTSLATWTNILFRYVVACRLLNISAAS